MRGAAVEEPGSPSPATRSLDGGPVSALVAFGTFEVFRLVRSWKFLAITIGFPVIFYILFLGDRTPGATVDGAVSWRVYLMVSMCSFGALVAALNAPCPMAARCMVAYPARTSGMPRLSRAAGSRRSLCT